MAGRSTLRGHSTYKLCDEVRRAKSALESAGVAAESETTEVTMSPALESVAALIMREAVKNLANRPRECKCGSALKNAIFTAPSLWPEATARKLAAIIGKYQK